MSAWKTIETCPTNRSVLLYGTMLPFEGISSEGKPLVFTGYWDSIDEQWCTTGSTWTGPFFEPTHWTEIPAPPQPGESNARIIAGPSK
jgi:hypothetical protein